MEHWSVEDYKNFTNNRNRKSKYRANKVSVDGHTFDSQKEADYYCELKSHTEEIENELQNADIEYEKVPWSKEAFVIKNVREKEIQKLDIYKDGKIYLQSLSSMLPPIML